MPVRTTQRWWLGPCCGGSFWRLGGVWLFVRLPHSAGPTGTALPLGLAHPQLLGGLDDALAGSSGGLPLEQSWLGNRHRSSARDVRGGASPWW